MSEDILDGAAPAAAPPPPVQGDASFEAKVSSLLNACAALLADWSADCVIEDSSVAKLLTAYNTIGSQRALMGEVERELLSPSRNAAVPPAVQESAIIEFARWVIQEGSWSGLALDGADIEEKARALGLIVETKYDPAVHGPNDFDADLGDPWFAFSDLLSLSPPSDGWREIIEACARVVETTSLSGINSKARYGFPTIHPETARAQLAAAIRALPPPHVAAHDAELIADQCHEG